MSNKSIFFQVYRLLHELQEKKLRIFISSISLDTIPIAQECFLYYGL